MPEAIEAVEEGYRAWAACPDINAPRQRTHTPANSRVSAHQGGVPRFGVTGLMTHCELVRVVPELQQQHIPVRGRPVTVLYSSETAELVCIIIGEVTCREVPDQYMIGLRTAATSAVGMKYLARRDAQTVGLFGSRGQAKNHLAAVCSIRPIKRAQVYSPNPEHRKAFAEEMSQVLEIEIQAVSEPQAVLEGADIVIDASNTNVPVFRGEWVQEGMHINGFQGSNIGLVRGGFIPSKRTEFDGETYRRCDVIVINSKVQTQQDEFPIGDAAKTGAVKWDHVWELRDLVAGKVPGRSSDRQITLLDVSGGQGIADVGLAGHIYQVARKKGVGVELPLTGAEHWTP
ncbi:MAG: ornithine cyclodeaminase family protein [Deltaproteobacteria bacterium]|nr:ornithine cyclodeaminase family protein [Deltaproteobacteria bacterium]